MIKAELEKWLAETLSLEKLELKQSRFADFSLTPGQLAQISSQSNLSSEQITQKLLSENNPSIAKISLEAGFLNITLTDDVIFRELECILEDQCLDFEKRNETVVIDYSGPNIAKPFSVGHLRSTVIGQANYNIHEYLGYNAIGINHIGDWGTQFGKLIFAILQWGKIDEIEKNPIQELNRLYVKFHEESEKDPKLEDAARAWSKRLEDNDPQARDLWKKCVDFSFKEFERIYAILGINIDNVVGESFYEDKLDGVISELEEKKLLKDSQGAKIVELENMPPALIKRQDGATLYMTRDLAALKYRIDTYHPIRIIYHVGQDQHLHFEQLKLVAEKLGWLKNTEIVFAGHGMMRLPEGKMSTRKGRVILLEDLIEEAKKRVELFEKDRLESDIKSKELDLAISAIKYADLSSNRQSDVTFSFDRLIDLKGNSAIYLQYTYARMNSLIREYNKHYSNNIKPEKISESASELSRSVIFFKETIEVAGKSSLPNILCEFSFSFANKFNSFYEAQRIVTDNELESAQNIMIVKVARKVLGVLLDLLGLSKFESL